MLAYDETPAVAARARLAARAVLGLLLDEQRAARFVYEYCSTYFRQGIAGEAEHKAELLSAIERESLLLVSARIEQTLPSAVAPRFSRLSAPEAVAAFRQAFLTFLGGSLAWDHDERESFRKDLALYLRLAARESRAMARRPGAPRVAGAFVDRCAFLVDPSMLGQAREAAARYQAQLESCADQALRAVFRGLRAKTAPGASHRQRPKPASKPKTRRKAVPRTKAKPRTKTRPKAKPRAKAKRAPAARRKAKPGRARSKPAIRRRAARRAKPATRRVRRPRTASGKRPRR